MRVEDFDYALPLELIAQAPATEREKARLRIVAARAEHDEDRVISELASLIEPGSLVVLNDTRVVPARILGTKEGSGGKAEVFLVRKLEQTTTVAGGQGERWRALARASKSLKPGTRIVKDALVIHFERKADDGLFEVRLETVDGTPVDEARRQAGQVPLPPYIRRELRAEDAERYQTVFARSEGAVAAPTAGLHLTRALLDRIQTRGCEIATCTLHVGLGTFQPVTVDDFDLHPMHSESFEITPALADAVAGARARGAPVLAVGTTVVRALESAKDPSRPGHVRACAEDTRILIQPGYQFDIVDRLLTNFHLPKSTLLALVCAFGGTSRVLETYAACVRESYRFFSYGDAMLLNRKGPERV
jgi:S-adenosylmethionine:tRNA ribosyltransferase-isomerase